MLFSPNEEVKESEKSEDRQRKWQILINRVFEKKEGRKITSILSATKKSRVMWRQFGVVKSRKQSDSID